MLPHKTQPVCCIFNEHRVAYSCAACIWQMTVNWPTQTSFHCTYCMTFQQRRGCFQSEDSGSYFLSGAAVERVCASLQGGPQTSALRCSFVYNCMANGRRTAVFVPVFTNYRTDCFVCGSLFKIQSQRCEIATTWVIWKKLLRVF